MRVIVYQASDTSALSKNFTRKDFKCPCGCSRQMVDSELVEKLQAIRDKLGKAIKVTSGYRCITHNASKIANNLFFFFIFSSYLTRQAYWHCFSSVCATNLPFLS